MKWEPAGVSYPVEYFGSFVPEEILYDFDGPRIFTARNRYGDILLAFQCDEDETVSRFVVVPCDATLVDALKVGRRSVRDALAQPWTWVVDQPHGQPVRGAWRAQLASIPKVLLPGESVMLLPAMEPLMRQPVTPHAASPRKGPPRQFPALSTVETRP